ncbi:transporter [Sebaldella sp. S0638]|uniref:transporter n=1 Tax=Sebaldella sp. S0638 TaxID=2957809 RepID=UPI00209CDF98|nr:transporter [Sebaldella sp. S0638]MCP1225330.1 transporter [Sebaldella sp. S0638]
MKRNKKLLVSFLALNSILASHAEGAETQISAKYDRMYNSIVKNIENGKSNTKNYQVIEQILNQKNKELKDLYLQSDYIVKPEYLEWQVFFTGFYEEYNKGVDNSKENAEYHSKVTGYYDANGNYVVTSGTAGGLSGKAYQPLQTPKSVTLGVSVPLKSITKDVQELSLNPEREISSSPVAAEINSPTKTVSANVNVDAFSIDIPDIEAPTVPSISSFNVTTPDTGNGDDTFNYLSTSSYYTAKIAQYNLTSGLLEGTWNTNSYLSSYNTENLYGSANPNGSCYTSGYCGVMTDLTTNTTLTSSGPTALYKLGGAEKITLGTEGDVTALVMRITSKVGSSYTGTLPHLIQYDPHGSRSTLYTQFDTDYYGNALSAASWTSSTMYNYYGGLYNYATLEGYGDNFIIIALQSHTGSFSPTVRNYGKIIGYYDDVNYTNGGSKQVAFTFTAAQSHSANANRRWELYNEAGGLIEMQAAQSIAVNFGTTVNLSSIPHYVFYNYGDVVLYGSNSYGIKTSSLVTSVESSPSLKYSKLVLKTPIRINGDSSIGIELANDMDDGYASTTNAVTGGVGYDEQPAEIRVTVGDEKNQYAGNITGKDADYVEGSIGLYVTNSTGYEYRIKDYEFIFGDYAKDSVLVYINNGILTLDNVTSSAINITSGKNNTGLAVIGNNSVLNLYPDVIVGSSSNKVDGTTALYASTGGKINLLDSNTIETNGAKSHGIVLMGGSYLNEESAGGTYNFIVTGDSSGTLYVKNSTVDLDNSIVNISATGDSSIGVYNNGGTVDLGTGTYEVGTNGVLLYNIDGTLTTGATNFTVGNGSIFSISETTGSTTKTNFTSAGTLNLLSGATGFLVNGNIGTYFSTYYTGLDNLDVVVDDGATLLALQGASSILSSLSFGSLNSYFNSLTINGNVASLLEGTLAIDQNVNLDDSTDAYNEIEKSLIGVTVNSGISMTGSQANQIALSDNFSSVTGVTYNNMINNGTISLSGIESIGIYANNGNITNSSVISATGNSSFGIYGENGTTTINTGSINIGDEGIGIYGVGYQDPATPGTYGGGTISITNTGSITGTGGSGTIGIYLDNNGGVALSNATVTLTSGSVIDLGNVSDAVGVYVNGGTLTGSGSTITVGTNGVGLYANDSDVDLANTIINLNGDNALGMYLSGTSSLVTSGTNTINIDGQNVVLFYIDSSGSISNNFEVGSVTSGSSYTLGKIVGGAFEYTGNSNLASNGTLVSGENAAVYLSGSTITSSAGSTNVAAAALDGQYAGSLPSGMTSGIDGENDGIITFGDSSLGLYGENGSRLSNKGTITLGNSSAGLMTSGSGSLVVNSGVISIGSNSQGIYVKDGVSASNTSTGSITSNGSGTVGIYADNNAVTLMPVTNDGYIDLTGDKSIGIYSAGTSTSDINNTGTIIVGNSSDAMDPSMGMYSAAAGSQIANSGTIISGENSIGIYSSGGNVINTGTLNIGNSGTGIYSTNGTVNLNSGTVINIGTNGAVAVFGISSAINSGVGLNIGNSNYGIVLQGGSYADLAGNTNTIGTDSLYLYATSGANIASNADLTMTGSDNVGFYLTDGGTIVNTGTIDGTAGNNNVGVYNNGGIVDNYGTIAVKDSDLAFKAGTTDVDVDNSKYSVGIYGENAAITNYSGGLISTGYGGYGVVAKGGTAANYGTISTSGDYSVGMYTEGGIITNESTGVINVSGNNTVGMGGTGSGSQIINNGYIQISGDNAIGMYAGAGTIITNNGTIDVSGNNAKALVALDATNESHTVSGAVTVNSASDYTIYSSSSSYTLPTLVNAGIIKTSGVLALDGIQVMIKTDLSTLVDNGDGTFTLSGTSLIADTVSTDSAITILAGFSDGTIANVYKLEGVIQASSGGTYDFISGSLLWEATPQVTADGVDVYMERIPFTTFTDGLWFEDFGQALEDNYLSAEGDAVTIYNKTAYIETEESFRHIIASLAGNVYANINQREKDIANVFEDSLHLLQNSDNNTKENVKIAIVAGKGKNKEETDGVVGYDYTATGAIALREVERTYRHTFGYSLGYLHTGFEFDDGNGSEEWVDTIQLGVHSKYAAHGWQLRNDLTGRASIHNVDRNINWGDELGRSEMNGTYETYSITSDNILGKEFGLGKKASIMPYGAFKAMYVTRPSFEESGLERLQVEGNDAWSVKPRAGVELKGALPLGNNTAWQLKGSLDVAYEYELADLNEREKARLIAIEDGYHNLSKPQDEKGIFKTKASVGVEIADRYGIFLTGQYSTGNDKEDDYRAGLTLKAVF